MENAGVDEAVDAFEAAAAEFVACVRRGLGGRGSGTGSGGGDPLREQSDACLDGLSDSVRVDSMVAAFRVCLAAGFAEKSVALDAPVRTPGEHTAQEMAVVSEVACALTVSERSASALLGQSYELITGLPLTLAALQDGSISWQHARVMVDETTGLDPAGAAALEARFLGPDAPDRARECPAGDMVPSRFRHKARTWRERHHPVSIEKRHAKSVLDRRLEYAPDRDGMAWLSAYLPAHQAAGIWNRMTAAARALQGPAETRTMTQIRADIAATLLLSGTANSTTTNSSTTGSTTTGSTNRTATVRDSRRGNGAGAGNIDPTERSAPDLDLPAGSAPDGDVAAGNAPVNGTVAGNDALAGRVLANGTVAGTDVMMGRVPSPAAQVLVTVPVFALMGLTDEPATLDGCGPIPASIARQLVADGASSFHRVLTDPRSGAPLEIGRDSYRVPAAMRQWLRMRDGKCPFPGCSNQSLDNEADHLLAWADGGTTGISNLGQPCPKHHRLKHSTAWTPTEASSDKPPGWASPTGRHYASEHQDWEPPWFPQIPGLLSDQGLGSASPDDTLPRHAQHADVLAEEGMPMDPFPEWAPVQWPVEEPDPDPEECPPVDESLPEDRPLDRSLPEDQPPDQLPNHPMAVELSPGRASFAATEGLSAR